MPENEQEERPLAYTPTWSVACVLTFFVAVSLLMERSISHLTNRLRKSKRKPLLEALEKMKEELMVLGFISFLLVATPGLISTICIPSKFFDSAFSPCSRSEIAEESEDNASKERKLFTSSFGRTLIELNPDSCKKGHEPIVSNEGIEQLHRLIFIMAVTHIAYSCLTMLLAIVKVHTWRAWEDEARMERVDHEITREMTRRQSALVSLHQSNPFLKNVCLTWVICFFRQFGCSVVRVDYITLRKAFIMNHNLTSKYDFHGYMIRSMEEEFHRIVGVSGPLWGLLVAFILFNVHGSNLYFWMAVIPFALILVMGAKLQHIIATLAMESSGVTKLITGTKLRPRDELFWFKKPELLLSLIHFTLFQIAFELASYFWIWWNFGKNSCFLQNHIRAYVRLVLGFAGQFLCSYSTLPLYALVTQMGTHYKAALIPESVRETISGWGKAARRKRRFRYFSEDSTVHTYQSSTDSQFDSPRTHTEIELQNRRVLRTNSSRASGESSSRAGTPLLKHSTSASSLGFLPGSTARSSSVPVRKD